MTQMMKYTLQDFMNITFNSFDFALPDDTMELINKLSCQVGSPTYIKTPLFQKRDMKDVNVLNFKKKKNNGKNVEEDWDTLRSFQTTKLEQKVGIDVQIDLIRSYLNKMTDRNFVEIKNKITELLDKLIEDGIEQEDITKIGENIFEIASNNRFYSKLYADLYSELIQKYDVMKLLFENSLNAYMDLFATIEYVDASEDYDKYCKINKINESRKAISNFFVNLMMNSIISKEVINNLIVSLFKQIHIFIYEDNKKNEVDELVENVSILYRKEVVEKFNSEVVDGLTVLDLIDKLAKSKSKNFNSLSNKSIFKFIDLVEM
jgi:hypothetical protein